MNNSKLSVTEIEELVLQAQAGDSEAFGKIYDAFVDQVYRYIFFKVSSKDDAFDLTENVFLKVWQNLKSYRDNNQKFGAWIFRIAHNLVVDFYRFRKESVELDVDIPDHNRDNNPKLLTEQSLSKDVLRKAISKLKKSYQEVILLKFINDLDNVEISRIMKRNEGSVRILKFRALKALRQILEQMNVSSE